MRRTYPKYLNPLNANDRKHCPSCGRVKRRENFHKDRSAHDGLCWECKSCKRMRQNLRDFENGKRPRVFDEPTIPKLTDWQKEERAKHPFRPCR